MDLTNQLNSELIQTFEDYFQNKLTNDAKVKFENQLKSDEFIKAAYDAYLLTREVVNEKIEFDLRTEMKNWQVESVKKPKVRSLSLVYWKRAVAACMIGLISLVGYKNYELNNFINTKTNEYFSYEVASRSENSSKVDQLIIELNETHSKKNALSELRKISRGNSDFSIAQKYLGYEAVREGDCKNTLIYLSNAKITAEELKLGLIFCQLNSNQIDENLKASLNEMASDSKNNNYKVAVDLKSKMSGFWWKLLK